MPRYRLTVAYDGTDFHGWQKQEPPPHAAASMPVLPSGELRTAQGVLEQAVRSVVREPVMVVGASRTDSGVHARGQVAAFSSNTHIPVNKLPRAISSRLPGDMQVLKAEIVAEDFDPIAQAIAKGYRYRIVHSCACRARPLFSRRYVMSTPYALDAARMNMAARRLMGEHDFTSFTRLHHQRESTVRTVFNCLVAQTSPRRCHIDIVGSGFLYNMVRIIAGTLLEIGRGEMAPEAIEEILAAKDRRAAGPTVPPEGLCLMWIRYPESDPSEPSIRIRSGGVSSP